jgi:hypothetical protein
MASKFAERLRKPVAALGFGVRSTATQLDASVPTITSGAGAPSASEPSGSLYLRTDGANLNQVLYGTQDGAGTWNPVEISLPTGAISDTNTYYTTDTVDGAFDALALQIGGDTDATFNFTEANVLADDDAIYAALEKLDLKMGDIASTANAEGASLVGVEDSLSLLAAANVEAALTELAKYVPIALADPGDAAAIPVTRSASVAITTGGSGETNTLAIPSFAGQVLVLSLDVDGGGDRVVTVAGAVNQTGNNTITLANAGESRTLRSAQVAGALVWRDVGGDAALSTV